MPPDLFPKLLSCCDPSKYLLFFYSKIKQRHCIFYFLGFPISHLLVFFNKNEQLLQRISLLLLFKEKVSLCILLQDTVLVTKQHCLLPDNNLDSLLCQRPVS